MRLPRFILTKNGRSILALRLITLCFVLLLASAIMLSAAMVHVLKTDNFYKPKSTNQTIIIDAGHGGLTNTIY